MADENTNISEEKLFEQNNVITKIYESVNGNAIGYPIGTFSEYVAIDYDDDGVKTTLHENGVRFATKEQLQGTTNINSKQLEVLQTSDIEFEQGDAVRQLKVPSAARMAKLEDAVDKLAESLKGQLTTEIKTTLVSKVLSAWNLGDISQYNISDKVEYNFDKKNNTLYINMFNSEGKSTTNATVIGAKLKS